VEVEGPFGEFVLDENSSRPVIFLAFGAGFAPIKSLVQHAMSLELAESMDLHWLADAAGHYQDNLCRAWADALDNFSYVPHAQADDLDRVLAAIVRLPGSASLRRVCGGHRGAVERACAVVRHGCPGCAGLGGRRTPECWLFLYLGRCR
jgi:CDP-4-dehydro-6-deoxyglucose reductase